MLTWEDAKTTAARIIRKHLLWLHADYDMDDAMQDAYLWYLEVLERTPKDAILEKYGLEDIPPSEMRATQRRYFTTIVWTRLQRQDGRHIRRDKRVWISDSGDWESDRRVELAARDYSIAEVEDRLMRERMSRDARRLCGETSWDQDDVIPTRSRYRSTRRLIKKALGCTEQRAETVERELRALGVPV